MSNLSISHQDFERRVARARKSSAAALEEQIKQRLSKTLTELALAGECLIALKAKLEHGGWLEACERLDLHPRYAQRLMRLARTLPGLPPTQENGKPWTLYTALEAATAPAVQVETLADRAAALAESDPMLVEEAARALKMAKADRFPPRPEPTAEERGSRPALGVLRAADTHGGDVLRAFISFLEREGFTVTVPKTYLEMLASPDEPGTAPVDLKTKCDDSSHLNRRRPCE